MKMKTFLVLCVCVLTLIGTGKIYNFILIKLGHIFLSLYLMTLGWHVIHLLIKLILQSTLDISKIEISKYLSYQKNTF